MAHDEMIEVADIVATLIRATTGGLITSGNNAGQASRVNFILDEVTRQQAAGRVADLLARHPLYPEVVLDA
jgi:glycine hydroxymethyltransferase